MTSIRVLQDTSGDFSVLILSRVPGFTVETHYQCLEKTFCLCWPGCKVFSSQHHFILMVKELTSQGQPSIISYLAGKSVSKVTVFMNQGSCFLHEGWWNLTAPFPRPSILCVQFASTKAL